MRGRRGIAAVLVLGAVAFGCSSDDDGGDAESDETEATTTTVAGPEVPGDEWTVSSPEDEGMDAAALEGAREYAFADGMNTQGVVVVRHGKIVAEWYAEGADQDSWTASWSMAKSFTSALIGIAIEEGKIPGVDEPMTTWFPEWTGSPREDITLENVLQMSSGLDWDEGYVGADPAESEIIQMVTGESNQLSFAASRPTEADAGSVFNYSSGDTMLLSGVIEQATGMPVHEYAQEKLFEPLGMEKADWWQDADGHTLTYCCLDTTSRGFARFGLLYLNEGLWDGEQVVPEEWVADSVAPADAAEGGYYGYQWWLGIDGLDEEVFSANGHDGQFIYALPEHDLLVVRNGTYVKDPGESIADPNLFGKYPSDGLVEGKGTKPPKDWDAATFLQPIVDSLTD